MFHECRVPSIAIDVIMKNKYLCLCGLAASMLLASCAGDDSVPSHGADTLNSDVPIQLNLSQQAPVSRAALGNKNSLGQLDGTFDTDGGKLGIFCLATQKIFGTENISWHVGVDNPNYIWMENVQADAKTTGDEGSRQTNIVWLSGEKCYYPMGSQYAYTFYGYYPYTSQIQHTGNQYAVKVTGLDGTVDLISGQTRVDADDEDAAYAYSAKYFRAKKEKDQAYDYSNYACTMVFKHKLMRFNIILQKGTSSTDEIKKIGISKAEILNAASDGKLIVASLDNANDNGCYIPDWSTITTLSLKDEGDADLQLKYLHDAERITVGEGFMVPVVARNSDGTYVDNGYTQGGMANKGVYRLRVEFKNEDDPATVYRAAQYELVPPAEGWKEGYEYDVVITVSTPLEIVSKALLVPWEKGTLDLE